MPKVVDLESKRAEILSAAARVFARQGYRGTSLQRVAAQAGIGKSSIYHYFATKQALFEALVKDLLEREEALFERIASSPEPAPQRLARLVSTVIEMFPQWSQAGPLLVDFLREEAGRRALRRTIRRARAALVRVVAEGQSRGLFRRADPKAIATLLLACLDGLLVQEVIEPKALSASQLSFIPEALLGLVKKGGRA